MAANLRWHPIRGQSPLLRLSRARGMRDKDPVMTAAVGAAFGREPFALRLFAGKPAPLAMRRDNAQ